MRMIRSLMVMMILILLSGIRPGRIRVGLRTPESNFWAPGGPIIGFDGGHMKPPHAPEPASAVPQRTAGTDSQRGREAFARELQRPELRPIVR